jgi:hypothetical protein
MPTTNARANARSLPKAKHSDAELFALVERVVDAHKRLELSRDDLYEAFQGIRRVSDMFPALRKTEADAQLGFFVGPGVGHLYEQEEIDRIRAFARAKARTIADAGLEDAKPFDRAIAILDAWASREERKDVERAADGDKEHRSRQRDYDGLAAELILMRPATIEGVMAKAKALILETPINADDNDDNDDNDGDALGIALRRFGPDEQTVTLSLTYDVLRLAAAGDGR